MIGSEKLSTAINLDIPRKIQKFNYFRINELGESTSLICVQDINNGDKIKFETILACEEKDPDFKGDQVRHDGRKSNVFYSLIPQFLNP